VLVTTELGGRGLHVDGLAFVLNWELPEKPSEYLHRIGRVGRQGARGVVYNLVTDRDGPMLRQVERLAAGGRLDTGEVLRVARERPKSRAPAPDTEARQGRRGERPQGRPGGRGTGSRR
jgi:superfamily II DNA/RNA helicase